MSQTVSDNSHFKSRIISSSTFPAGEFHRDKDLLIIDKAVLAQAPEQFSGWNFVYEVSGGEHLKDLESFPRRLDEIVATWNTLISRQSRIVACGGGSVGDFAGFVASVLKRGVVFEQVPSTWLAAIDSAHGGKTALNLQGAKNQIGTFYPAKTVYLVKSILETQPAERALEGLGELVKISLIDKNKMFYAITDSIEVAPAELLWRFLQKAIDIKYEIVLQDPYELSGLRKILNFGHTMGHIFESYYSRSHGESVMQGLWFALEWSVHKKILAQDVWKSIQAGFGNLDLQRWTDGVDFVPMDSKRVLELLAQDKKITANEKVDFIFLSDVGLPLVQSVFAEEILVEGLRQGWVRG